MSCTPQSKYVLVMGVSGSGRTKLINSIVGSTALPEGNGLQTCTTLLQMANCVVDGQHVQFIDTPGFDADNAAALWKVKHYIREMRNNGQELTGIIYTHRVVDHRDGDSAIKDFNAFCKTIGRGAMHKVVIATTMWSDISKEEGERRYQTLCAGHFQNATKYGATVAAYDGTKTSGEGILRDLLSRSPSGLSLPGILKEATTNIEALSINCVSSKTDDGPKLPEGERAEGARQTRGIVGPCFERGHSKRGLLQISGPFLGYRNEWLDKTHWLFRRP